MSFEMEGLHVTRARNNMKIMGLKKAFRGFSIIELLIAIIIIGILVAIIVPRLATRSEQARRRAAESDLEEIRKAEEHAGIDTGYYYRLYVLDDNRGRDGYGWGDSMDVNDGLGDETINHVALNPTRMYINYTTGDIYPDISASIIYTRMMQNETAFNWNGRYITWHKDSDRNDIPDDPWGHDYLFFTPKTWSLSSIGALVLEPYGIVVQSCSIDANGNVVSGGDYKCDIFDRFVILSLGANGLPGDGSGPGATFGTGDDIIQKW